MTFGIPHTVKLGKKDQEFLRPLIDLVRALNGGDKELVIRIKLEGGKNDYQDLEK